MTSPNPRSSAFSTRLVIAMGCMILVYATLHAAFPSPNKGAFFWDRAPLQWLDWIFWGVMGTLLAAFPRDVRPSLDGVRDVQEPSKVLWGIARGLAFNLLLLAAAVYWVQLDVLGLRINLKQSPELVAAIAFVLGLYPRVTDRLVFELAFKFLKRVMERILGRSVSDQGDEEAYIELHVDPRLQAAYRRIAVTQSGLPGHKKSLEKRAAYKVAKFISKAGFTVNALKTIYIAQDLLESHEDVVLEIMAHEASHLHQGHWSDSIDQEIKAYTTGVKVIAELKKDRKMLRRSTRDWLILGDQLAPDQPDKGIQSQARAKAEKKVRDMKSLAPLYGIIPTEQKIDLHDKVEFLRQAVFLLLDMLGVSDKFFQEK